MATSGEFSLAIDSWAVQAQIDAGSQPGITS